MNPKKIRILPDQVINRIAAGEVIERPASVVKELVENSLDAEADSLEVECRKGGKEFLRIMDNGQGMGEEDIALALKRHATSKLQDFDDLFHIATRGFRGEALPAIASVSRMKILSRQENNQVGTELECSGGKMAEQKPVACSKGTVIEIRDLFFNQPARKKFLKADYTEQKRINEVLTQFALLETQVALRFIANGNIVYHLDRGDSMRQRVALLFGEEIISQLVEVEEQVGQIKVTGFLSLEEKTFPTGANIFTFVNRRCIKDRTINAALMDIYRKYLPKGRFPFALLLIQAPGGIVDVNVHPQKREVRFADHSLIFKAVRRSAERVFVGNQRMWEANFPFIGQNKIDDIDSPAPTWSFTEPAVDHQATLNEALPDYGIQNQVQPVQDVLTGEQERQSKGAKPQWLFGDYSILGQLWDQFILIQTSRSFLLIDQHAAHERIAFEELKRSYLDSEYTRRQTLLPFSLEVDRSMVDILSRNLQALEKIGIDLEHFGGTTFVLKAVPLAIVQADPASLLETITTNLSLLEEVCQQEAEGNQEWVKQSVEPLLEKFLATLACHSVVRGKRKMREQEIEQLLVMMQREEFSPYCPHGRPVIKIISRGQVEEWFKRS